MPYCEHCGRELPEDAIFCGYCGHRTEPQDSGESLEETRVFRPETLLPREPAPEAAPAEQPRAAAPEASPAERPREIPAQPDPFAEKDEPRKHRSRRPALPSLSQGISGLKEKLWQRWDRQDTMILERNLPPLKESHSKEAEEAAPATETPKETPAVQEEAAPAAETPKETPAVQEEAAPAAETPKETPAVQEEAAPVTETPKEIPAVQEEAAPVTETPKEIPAVPEEAAPATETAKETPVEPEKAAPAAETLRETPIVQEEAAPVVAEMEQDTIVAGLPAAEEAEQDTIVAKLPVTEGKSPCRAQSPRAEETVSLDATVDGAFDKQPWQEEPLLQEGRDPFAPPRGKRPSPPPQEESSAKIAIRRILVDLGERVRKKPVLAEQQAPVEQPQRELAQVEQVPAEQPQRELAPELLAYEEEESARRRARHRVAWVAAGSVGFLALLVAAGLLWYNEPVRSFQRYFEAGEYSQALSVYNQRIRDNEEKSQGIQEMLESHIGSIYQQYLNKQISAEEARSQFQTLNGFSFLAEPVQQAADLVEAMEDSRRAFAQLEEAMAAGDYAQALLLAEQVLPEDPNQAAARELQEQALEALRQVALEESNALLEAGDYDGAFARLDQAEQELGQDEQFQEARDAAYTYIVEKAMDEAAAQAAQKNFGAAAERLQAAAEYLGDAHTPDDLLHQIEVYISYIPVPLLNVDPVSTEKTEGDQVYRNEYLTDNQGNGYSYSLSMSAGSLTYQVGGKYRSLSGTVAFPADATSTALKPSARLEVYGDGALIWTSGEMSGAVSPVNLAVNIENFDRVSLKWVCTGLGLWNSWGYYATLYNPYLQPVPLE